MTVGKIISSAALATILLAGGAGIAMAQTTTTTGTTGTTGTVGVPNTGAGGDAAVNILLLGTSALIAIGGGSYLARKLAVR